MPIKNQYNPQSRPHPGETLAEKLQEMQMGPKEFALRTDKPEKTIIAVLKGESSITPDMAVLFEMVTKIPANFWMNHQRGYDEFMARKKRELAIKDAAEWTRQFPWSEMVQKQWLPPLKYIHEKTSALFSFFGFSNHTAWEEYYFNQQLKVAFRISLKKSKDPYAISAWLRQGELQAAALKADVYTDQKFKGALEQIQQLTHKNAAKNFHKLQQLCLDAGVKLVHTPRIAKAPIKGATRWLNSTPLIQLSDISLKNDTFWFTFFHEAAHILLHGKKEIFLENLDYSDKDIVKEEEANAFAAKWTNA